MKMDHTSELTLQTGYDLVMVGTDWDKPENDLTSKNRPYICGPCMYWKLMRITCVLSASQPGLCSLSEICGESSFSRHVYELVAALPLSLYPHGLRVPICAIWRAVTPAFFLPVRNLKAMTH